MTRSARSVPRLDAYPAVTGWVRYYGLFYPSKLYRALQTLDQHLVMWARRKYKGLAQHTERAWSWQSRMNREIHVRFWESLGVRLPRATHWGCTCGANIYVGTINDMLVTFDPPKNARNVAERGIPFRLALRLEWSTALIGEDTRKDYGEKRLQALGFIGDKLHMLVFTPRPPALHVISLRWANDRERTKYAAQTQS